MGCPYKFIFGVPEKGFHSQRFMGFALNDFLGTLGLALITTYFLKIKLWISFIGWFIIGELMHYYFGVQTSFLTLLGIEACP